MSSGPNVEDYTAGGWAKAGDDRWRRPDELGVMHLLIKVGTRFCELHGMTLHVYSGPDTVKDDVWPMGDPSRYDPVVHNFAHLSTDDVSGTAVARYTDEADAWAWLARYGVKYAK